ncbi:hypothetical protein CRG98_005174 [Punica granatum]|uniref:Uncharacterized protein n=1 Tax=Punica granatum TaxID=22663 RepID=A0A2I0L1E1_PUNGR|nr:hypothetical protein CRG98_005174 [Punica granatum]
MTMVTMGMAAMRMRLGAIRVVQFLGKLSSYLHIISKDLKLVSEEVFNQILQTLVVILDLEKFDFGLSRTNMKAQEGEVSLASTLIVIEKKSASPDPNGSP